MVGFRERQQPLHAHREVFKYGSNSRTGVFAADDAQGFSLVAWRVTPTDAWFEQHVLLVVWCCAMAAVAAA
jgi:hypothetical protein